MNNPCNIRFAQTNTTTWRCCTPSGVLVAVIRETLEDAAYRVTYYRQPSHSTDNPHTTTRTLQGNLDHAQARVMARGWH